MGDKLEDLLRQYDECRLRCEILNKEIEDIRQFERKQLIEGITLKKDAKLIDLLHTRILDMSPEWKSKIDTLISIPHSDKGVALNGGDYIEALFQLAIAIGILPQFRGYPVTFYDIDKYKNIKELKNYLYRKSVFNHGGGEQGISDISFRLQTSRGNEGSSQYSCGEIPTEVVIEDPTYFISVKGFKREKSVGKDYDIPLLYQQLEQFPELKNKHIVVCVRNKSEFLKRLSRTRMEFLKNSIDHVIGYDEVMDAFAQFRTNFRLRFDEEPTSDDIMRAIGEIFPEGGVYKPSLSLYFHQELVVKSVIQRISENPEPKDPYFLCIGVLPRGGKSYIAGGIIDAHKKLLGKGTYNALFLTSAVNETRDQFKDDLIDKFSEFDDFEFTDVVKQGKRARDVDKNKFVFVSRQLSSLSGDSEVEKSLLDGDFVARLKRILKDAKFDICFFDEAHIGIKSETVRKQFKETFEQFQMPIVLMSATYRNPAMVLSSPKDLFVWDLQDIKDMKRLPTLGLNEFIRESPDVLQRYPDIAETILRRRIYIGQTESEIAKPYMNFPMPNFISLTFAPDTIRHLRDVGGGYDFLKAFQIRSNTELLTNNDRYLEWGTLLVNREEALRIRQFLTPEQIEGDDFLTDKDRKYRALNQVFQIAQRTNSRPVLGKPFSILMFLPFGQKGMPIGELCRIWGSFFREVPYWKDNYVFMTLSTYAKHKPIAAMTPELAVKRGLCHRDDFSKYTLKEAILAVEREALKNGKGLVLLSGDVAKMGISLKCVDVVCLMSNTTDPDDIIQKMYRALTDDPPTKKNGYIIDLNLKRIVDAMFSYDMEKARRTETSSKTKSTAERMEQLMELCNWGQDAFIQDNSGKTFDDIMNEIKTRVFAGIEERVRLQYGSRDLADKQFQLIRDNDELFKEVREVLKFTTGKRTSSAAKVVLSEVGKDIPAADKEKGEAKPRVEEEEKEPEVEPLSEEEIKKKIVNIMLTFINALVIKSDEPWKGMTFEKLIERYKKDKPTAKKVCDCEETQECGGEVSNIYDIAFCELKSYAMLEQTKKVAAKFKYSRDDLTYQQKASERRALYSKKDKGEEVDEGETVSRKTEPVYSPETHESIMRILDSIFEKSGTLASDWTVYIEALISDITKRAELEEDDQDGGDRRKTERNKTKDINNNVRSTRRNNP